MEGARQLQAGMEGVWRLQTAKYMCWWSDVVLGYRELKELGGGGSLGLTDLVGSILD